MTGGLVPCPAGITLVIFSVSFEGQNTFKCFLYLTAFSAGLAGVLIAVAVSMVLSKKFLVSDTPKPRTKRILSLLPIVSCVAVAGVGLLLCYQAYDPDFVALKAKLALLLG